MSESADTGHPFGPMNERAPTSCVEEIGVCCMATSECEEQRPRQRMTA